MISDLNGSHGSRQFLNVANKRTCFASCAPCRARAHLKVPGCSLVWNALLTKKLPMFLSRLNEINGGCEKILPVSGSVFFKNDGRVGCLHARIHFSSSQLKWPR